MAARQSGLRQVPEIGAEEQRGGDGRGGSQARSATSAVCPCAWAHIALYIRGLPGMGGVPVSVPSSWPR